ncbi:MAG TPA: acyl-CoA dehydrogenase family protein [Acidimicrobiia bacterium]|nr:acyl-CoA dehydrogenase family protein [Acidimicrobiia bacterium]
MDLNLSDDQQLLRETAAKFIAASCPLTKVRELAETDTGIDPEYLRQTAELGWYAALVPEEHGGGSISGDGLSDAAIVAEERGRMLQPGPFVPANVVGLALSEAGTAAQQVEVLPAIVAGEAIATWAVASENGSYDTGAALRCRADGTGFVVSGTAGLVQDAHQADWFLVTAGSDEGLTQFLLPAATSGIRVEPRVGLDLSRRFALVHFDDVAATDADVVGDVGAAAALVERQLDVAVVLSVAETVGAMDENFTVALDYAKVRTAFGRPIGSFQAVKHQLADVSMMLEASKGMATGAVRSVSRSADDASEVASMTKSFVGDAAIDLTQTCWQVFGGIGYTWEHDHHLYLRRLTADASLYGQPSWHRERICTIHGL